MILIVQSRVKVIECEKFKCFQYKLRGKYEILDAT